MVCSNSVKSSIHGNEFNEGPFGCWNRNRRIRTTILEYKMGVHIPILYLVQPEFDGEFANPKIYVFKINKN